MTGPDLAEIPGRLVSTSLAARSCAAPQQSVIPAGTPRLRGNRGKGNAREHSAAAARRLLTDRRYQPGKHIVAGMRSAARASVKPGCCTPGRPGRSVPRVHWVAHPTADRGGRREGESFRECQEVERTLGNVPRFHHLLRFFSDR